MFRAFKKNGLKIVKNIKICTRFYTSKQPPWSVLFFGTDDFSLYSCKALHQEFLSGRIIKNFEIVTNVKNHPNIIRKFAEKNKLTIHSWPNTVLKDQFDVGIVVSFGHLIPGHIIDSFPYGMLNIHASLLPRWRGAAPIIYALANGDTVTGVTIMKIRPERFDVGEIVHQEKVAISNEIKMLELHERLGIIGANCLIKVLSSLPESLQNAKLQPNEGVTLAPKVNPDFAVINWSTMHSSQIYNLSRAVEGYLNLKCTWKNVSVKLYDIKDCGFDCDIMDSYTEVLSKPGFVKYDKKCKSLRIFCANRTLISVGKIAVFGKKVMSAADFNNGYIKKEAVENRFFK